MRKRILFASDIDNTLIRSYKHRTPGDMCVEYIDDNPQSYMSRFAFDMLGEICRELWFVPVTTRSMAQYNRVNLGIAPEYAFTNNGGIHLINGVRCCDWDSHMSKILTDAQQHCTDALEIFSRSPECSKERIVDDIFAFCISDYPDKTCAALNASATLDGMNIVNQGRKVYAIPTLVTKGEAVSRLKIRLNAHMLVCAGDSALDVDMLNLADVAIVPNEEMGSLITALDVRVHKGGRPFEDFVLECVRDVAG